MKRSPSQGDLGAMSNGASRGVHHDLHFGGETTTPRPNQPRYPPAMNPPAAIPGQWPSSPPPPPMQQTRPTPQPSALQWAAPGQTPMQPSFNTRPDPYAPAPNQWAQPVPQNDFLDMPEPTTTPIPPPLPARQQTTPLYQWDPNSNLRTSPQKSPCYGPLATLPATLKAGLPRYDSPPTLPPKVPFSSSPPPLPPRDHDPYHEHYHQQPNLNNSTPPQRTPSPRFSLHPDDTAYYPTPGGHTPPPRPSTGPRLSPDTLYGSVPPRPSSHPELNRPSNMDVPFFVPPTQRPPSNPPYHPTETTPPRPDRYSPRPSPPGILDYPSPVGNAAQYPPQQPIQFQEPPRVQYQKPPRPQYHQPRPDPYQQPHPDPYRRPSPTHIPPRHSPTQPSPPRQNEWRPSPPTQKGPSGPVTNNPPPNSLIDLRHLPFHPILQPEYHRATLDHAQHFAKSSLLKILVIPAESTTFVAGGEIYGRMDINCKGDGGGSKGKSELLVGEIGIELIAYDESRSDAGGSPPRSHVFLLSRRTFQAPFDKNAPLDKVTSAIAYPTTVPPDDNGYRQPAKGTTIFPFRFQLPSDIGSAVECGQEVRTRYTLTGYAKVKILGSIETLINSTEVDVVEQLPYNHIYRNPNYKPEELKVRDTTDKSFRGKVLAIEATIPRKWYKAGETVPVTIQFTPTGYKKVGWIKITLVNRVTIHGKAGQSKEVTLDYGVKDEKLDDDTDFDPEKISHTLTLPIQIPKTCRTVSTSLFDVKQYLKIFILHKPLSLPFALSLPAIEVYHPASLETIADEAEGYPNVAGSYTVREIDTRGGSGKVVNERSGTNRVVGWSWYVDKSGRSKVF